MGRMWRMTRMAMLGLVLLSGVVLGRVNAGPAMLSGSTGAYIDDPADGATVNVGQSVTFTGDTDLGTTFAWTFGDGGKGTGRAPSHTYTAAGNYTVNLNVTRSGYATSSASITLHVVATVPAPTIQSFTATPGIVAAGSSSTLAWSATGATSYSISGIGTVTGTSRVVTPTATTTYTLTATNATGSATASVTVTYNRLPVFSPALAAQTFSANVAQTITLPGATDPDSDAITYSVTGLPAGLTFTPATRVVSGSATVSGSFTVTEKATDARGAVATQSAVWTVTIPSAPQVATLSASPAKINPGQTSVLSWTTANPIAALDLSSVGSVLGLTSKSVTPSTTTTYTLSATNLGGTGIKTVVVTVNRAPTLAGAVPAPALRVNDYVAVALPGGSDPDGDTLTYTTANLPPGLSLTQPDLANGVPAYVTGVPTKAGTYSVTETVTDPMGLTATSTVASWVVAAADSTTPAPTPSLPPDDSVFTSAKAKFTETLGYAGSEIGLITSVQVNRQLQEGMAALATGRDQATRSTYTYGYDPLGQLVTAAGTWQNASGNSVTYYSDPATQTTAIWADNTTYYYDAHGNRTSHSPNVPSMTPAPPAYEPVAARGAWLYGYKANSNQLLTAGPRTFTYTPDGAVASIVNSSSGDSQTLVYGDPRHMRLPTTIRRLVGDGRTVLSDMIYDMSGTRVSKRDQVWQGAIPSPVTDRTQLISDRETIYLANGTETLMEVEQRSVNGVVAPPRYTAYIFGAGSRLARLSWDNDGRSPSEASPNVGVTNSSFDGTVGTLPVGWTATGGPASVASDASQGTVLKLVKTGTTYVEQSLGTFAVGDTLEINALVRGDGAGGIGQVNLSGAATVMGPTTSSSAWQAVVFRPTITVPGTVNLRLQIAGSADNLQAFFDQVVVRKLLPATVAGGSPNLWPDPGFESVLGQGGGVTANPNVAIVDGEREGKHLLSIYSGGAYSRVIGGLNPSKTYLFSVWKKVNGVWSRELRNNLAPDSCGNLSVSLSVAGMYDQAELVLMPTGTVESWIPENRLGRVDWFVTDHLGSTKLLVDQFGTLRFTGDDDPFGVNLRSSGDKDAHRFTGQVLDEEQGVYYYGARFYLPEIGRFLSGDPLKETHSIFVYCGNRPVDMVDTDGRQACAASPKFLWNKNPVKEKYTGKDVIIEAPIMMLGDSYGAVHRARDMADIEWKRIFVPSYSETSSTLPPAFAIALLEGGAPMVNTDGYLVFTAPRGKISTHCTVVIDQTIVVPVDVEPKITEHEVSHPRATSLYIPSFEKYASDANVVAARVAAIKDATARKAAATAGAEELKNEFMFIWNKVEDTAKNLHFPPFLPMINLTMPLVPPNLAPPPTPSGAKP